MSKRSKASVFLVLCFAALSFVWLFPQTVHTASADDSGLLDPWAYLPVIHHNVNYGIHGDVTYLGSPIASIPLDLRFYNGTTWSTRASTTTDGQGMFSFTGVPHLLPGQYYYVRYTNSTVPSYLYTWHTASLDSYAGESVRIDDFDIRNIELTSPASGAVVATPRTFTWAKRANSPTDSYEFNLFDYADGIPYFWTDPPLGYVGSYTLQSLPAGFVPNFYYAWDIWVYDGLGGYGISYWAYWVKFTGSGPSLSAVPGWQIPRSAAVELDLAPMPNTAPLDIEGQR